jgi:type II secretory pathway component PulF
MDSSFNLLNGILAVLFWLVLWLGPFCLVFWVGYHFINLRLRRQERSRFFLNLLETGLVQGNSVEQTIISISNSRDPSMGVYFHLLAFHLKDGLSFGDALKKVPQMLPPQISAMLLAGLKIGDLSKVLPACRQLSRDAVSQTRGAINYLVLVGFVGFPINIVMLTLLQVYVLPQFMAVCEGMGIPAPVGVRWLQDHEGLVFAMQALLLVIVWCAVFIYTDGSKLITWLNEWCSPLIHRIIYALPWRRKRLQRDFSAMLAILIDAGMPEPEALASAADCTANQVFQQRAQRGIAGLQSGLNLTDAVQLVDDSGEFRWRLTNALHAHAGFFKAIAGWNESLDAKAFQQEQATAQAVTTGIVMLNGVLVGFIVVSIFSVLISIINAGVLW